MCSFLFNSVCSDEDASASKLESKINYDIHNNAFPERSLDSTTRILSDGGTSCHEIVQSTSKVWFHKECTRLNLIPSHISQDNTQGNVHEAVLTELKLSITRVRRLLIELNSSKIALFNSLPPGITKDIVSAHVESTTKWTPIYGKIEKLIRNQFQGTFPPLVLDGEDVLNRTDLAILSLGPKFVFKGKHEDSDIHAMFETAARSLPAGDDKILTALKHEMYLTQKENSYNAQSYIIKNLKAKLQRHGLVLTKADKECRLVIMSRTRYTEKMGKLLSSDKFETVKVGQQRGRPSDKNIFEKKTQECKQVIGKIKHLSYHVPVGWRQANLYGLAKTHKPEIPLRPVLSAPGCYNHGLAKFLSKIISEHTDSQRSVKDVFEFLQKVTSKFSENEINENSLNSQASNNKEPGSSVSFSEANCNKTLASFDVESLFTSIPLDFTIRLVADKIFDNKLFLSIDHPEHPVLLLKGQFIELLELAVKDQLFTFNDVVYKQVDGVSMGSPLGPVLANFFLVYLENECIDWDSHFAPLSYFRYVDDTFLIFSHEVDILPFWEHLSSLSVLNFTIEVCSPPDGLPFIGALVSQNDEGHLITDVYRRQNVSFMSSLSHVPHRYKIAAVRALLFRASKICSSLKLFHEQVHIISTAAHSAGLSRTKVSNLVERLANHKESKSTISVPQIDSRFVKLPFVSETRCKAISSILHPINIVPTFIATSSIYSILRVREPQIPSKLGPPGVVYKFTCPQCHDSYVGLTLRPLSERVKEHARPGSQLEEAHGNCAVRAQYVHFSVLAKSSKWFEIRVKEAWYIKQLRPALNSKVEGRVFCLRM